MNEVTFMLAVLLEKKVITPKEAIELRKVAVEQTLNNSLKEMGGRVKTAIDKANAEPMKNVQSVSAKDFLGKVLQ